jgi:hypothetical protein
MKNRGWEKGTECFLFSYELSTVNYELSTINSINLINKLRTGGFYETDRAFNFIG